MNLRDELMAKCSTSGALKNSKKKKLNVITIQRGLEKRRESAKKHCFSTSASTSNEFRARNSGREISVTETSTTFDNSNDSDSKIVLAITQGRGEATCEVGIAAINIVRPCLLMCQISDTLSYTNVLTKINILNPVEILIPTTTSKSRLTDKLKQYFKNVKILGVPRSTFNSNNGFNYVKKLCASNWNSIVLMVQYKYYALTAVSALFSYTETHLYVFYAGESMKVEYEESEGYTIIDVLTADKLELVACALEDTNPKYSSLRGILNNCVTKIGSRTLRATILQPPCCLPEIEARLNCVEELVKNQIQLLSIREILKQISRIDQLLTLATIMPERAQSCSVRQLNYILLLNSVFDLLEPLSEVLSGSHEPYFTELRDTLLQEDFMYLKNLIRTVIHENARPAVGEQGVTERCFAIKSEVNPILDIIRKRYSERLDEMRDYVRQLGETYKLDLKLSNNVKKGYHIVLKLNKYELKSFKLSSLPEEFIHVERLMTMVTMTTIDIQSFQIRIEDISAEIIRISNVILYKLLVEIQKHVGLFYKLCEQIAKVDMLQSLAQSSSSLDKYVRPKFNVFTEVIDGRHPLLEYLCDKDPIGNDIFASPQHNMHIVTGPNSSGKSIYIRQAALLQIMAQIGCFVPATSATFRVADRILARIYLEDDMYCGVSTFTLEIQEIKYFFNVMTPNTLIIIDELCRSTSILEGTALAMGICEKLLQTPAFTFFTTHYTFITKLHDLYYNVKCWQLETEEIQVGNETKLRYTHKLLPGVTNLDDYAIQSAKTCWPTIVMCDVENVKKYIHKKELRAPIVKINQKQRLKFNLEADLQILKYKSVCTKDAVRNRLLVYQEDLQKVGSYINWTEDYDAEQQHNISYAAIQQDEAENISSLDYNILQPVAVYSNSSVDNFRVNDSDQILEEHMDISNENDDVNEFQNNIDLVNYANFTESTENFYQNEPYCGTQQVQHEQNFEMNYEGVHIVHDYAYESEPEDEFSTVDVSSNIQMECENNYEVDDQIDNNIILDRSSTPGTIPNYYDCEQNKSIRNRSLQSIGEFQFAIPLRKNIDKTSTPIVVPTRPIMNTNFSFQRGTPQTHQSNCLYNNKSFIPIPTNELRRICTDYSSQSIASTTDDLCNSRHISRSELDIAENNAIASHKFIYQDELNKSRNSASKNLNENSHKERDEYNYQEECEEDNVRMERDKLRNSTISTHTATTSDKEHGEYVYQEDSEEDMQTVENYESAEEGSVNSKNLNANALEEKSISYSPDYEILALYNNNDHIINKSIAELTTTDGKTMPQDNGTLNSLSTSIRNNFNTSSNLCFDNTSNTVTITKSTDIETTHKSSSENASTSDDNLKIITASADNKASTSTISSAQNKNDSTSELSLYGDSNYSQEPNIENETSASQTTELTSRISKSKNKHAISKHKKSKPMHKMTKKEIDRFYYERDLKFLYTTGDRCVQYSEEILNRPKAKQIKASTQIAMARKTRGGTVVVPCEDKAGKRQRKCAKFNPPLKHNVGKQFDVTIFSDENSHIFDQFMQSEQNEKKDTDFFNKVFHRETDTSASSYLTAQSDMCPNTSFFQGPAQTFSFREEDSNIICNN